ncbi:ribonuclease P protein component [Rhodococcus sp. NPDC058521]|uniref:ribonuclease P protein component n=1 Tax=Rhodococcus sp. NPDC058521 TaxID=3346536 RepID=UPI00365327F2
MLPEPNRLRRHSDFSSTVKRGRRSGRRDVVVHAFDHATTDELIRVGGPRFGLVVSKAVGPAVIRHRVARRLRHICIGLVDRVPEGTDIVIRALPGAATAGSSELEQQIQLLLQRMNLLESVSESV